MNARMLKTACLLAGLVGFGPVGLSETRDTVTAPVDKVLVPTGLTTRHTVELTLTGVFPNTCYAMSKAAAEVDQEAKVVKISAQAAQRSRDDVQCAQVLTRFVEPVVIGPLAEGVYTIYVVDRPEAEAEPLVIDADGGDHAEATYAPVDRAIITRTDGGDPQIEVAGRYPYTLVGCMVMTDFATAREPGNVLLVEPFAEYTEGERCADQAESKAFLATSAFAEPLEPGVYLVQVRTFGGGFVQRVAVID